MAIYYFGTNTPTQEGTTVTAYSLTVNREKLVGLLKKRRTEIDTFYDEKRKEITDQLDKAKSPEKAWAEWYRSMAKRVEEGSLIIDPKAPQGQKVVPAPGQPPKPSAPELVDVERLTTDVNVLEERRTRAKLPYDTAIDMLEIAVGDEVEIPVSEYEVLIKKPQALY